MTDVRRHLERGSSLIDRPLIFRVDGFPIPKGSWKIVQRRGARPSLVPDNPGEPTWANLVGWTAKLAMRGREIETWPVRVSLWFVLAPPEAGKPYSKTDYAALGDLDKLTRSCLDAMIGIVYTDDRQVVAIDATKRLVDHEHPTPGVQITVEAAPAYRSL